MKIFHCVSRSSVTVITKDSDDKFKINSTKSRDTTEMNNFVFSNGAR